MANQYFTCVIDAWVSGRTLYGRMHYYRTDGRTYTYTDTSFPTPTMDLGGVSYSDEDFANRVRSGIDVGDVYSTTFSRVPAGSGNRTVTWTAGSGLRSDFAGSWSQTVYVPPDTSPPTGLSVSNIVRDTESFTADVSITGWGTGGTAADRYLELQCWTYNASSLTQPRRYQVYRTSNLSANITVDNNSGYSPDYGPLNIVGNTRYTLGAYATNGAANTGSQRVGDYTTLAYPASLQTPITSGTTATVYYSTRSDGGMYTKTYEYSLDNGSTWTTFATVSSGSASSGSFNLTGLSQNTLYTIKHRVTTTAGTKNGEDVTFSIPVKNKFYGSVNDEATKIGDFYGAAGVPSSITGVSGIIIEGNWTANNILSFDGVTFWNTMSQDADFMSLFNSLNALGNPYDGGAPIELEIYYDAENGWYVYVCVLTDSNQWVRGILVGDDGDYTLSQIGITAKESPSAGEDGVDLYPSYSETKGYMTKKLYGPVGNELQSLNLDTTATYTLITNINETDFIRQYNSWIKGSGAGIFYNDEIQEIKVAHRITSNDNYYDFYLVGKMSSNPSIDRSYSLSISGNVNTVKNVAATWGITFSGNSTTVADTVAATPEYSPVTKLVHQSFGHLTYAPQSPDYGIVYYRPTSSSPDSEIQSVEIANITEFNSLCNDSYGWSATLGNGSVTVRSSGNSNIIVGIEIGNLVTSIGDYFLKDCSGISMPVVVPGNVTTIGNSFLREASFNQSITIESGVTSIGDYFLSDNYSFNQPLTIPDSVTSIGNSFLEECDDFNSALTLPANLTSIGDSFLQVCTSFNQSLSLPNSLLTIGDYFMTYCINFNKAITLPSSLTSIGRDFLSYCIKFNNSINLPSTLTSIGVYFLCGCQDMGSTVNVGSLAATIAATSPWSFGTSEPTSVAYRVGIAIGGSNRSAWLSRFPNSSSSPYRNLRDAGS